MLAKCAKCQKVFPTDHYGPNTCPACGAELMLADPMAANKPPEVPATGPGEQPPAGEGSAAPEPSAGAGAGTGIGGGAVPPQGAPAGWDNVPPAGQEFVPDEQLQPTPWEERATRGFFPALFETIKQSFVDPVNFFARMRTDDIVQPLFYYWIVAGFGALTGNLWQALFSAIGTKPTELPAGNPLGPYFERFMSLQSHPLTMVGTALVGVAFTPVVLFVYAGILHLFAMLFRCANRGFSATLRTVAYSSGPMVLAAVPICGSFIGWAWSLVLTVIGLWKMQRGTVGGAVGAVATPFVLSFCCTCLAVVAIFGMAGMAAAAVAGAGN